ncbi:MAG: GyrI-like domain-containing protein [Acidobacteriaceae bacterium]
MSRSSVYSFAMLSAASRIAFCLLVAVPPAAIAQTTPAQTTPAPAASPATVENQQSFTVVGMTVRTNNAAEAGGQGQIPQLWQRVMSANLLDQIPNRAGSDLVVVYSDYASDNNGDYNCTLGVPVLSVGKLPDGFVAKTIQAGRYAVFTSDQGPPEQVVPALWMRIARLTPAELGGTRAYQTDFEIYPADSSPDSLQMTAHVGLK